MTVIITYLILVVTGGWRFAFLVWAVPAPVALYNNVLHTVILMYDLLVFVDSLFWTGLNRANPSFSIFLNLLGCGVSSFLLFLLQVEWFLLLEHFLLVKVVGFRSSLERILLDGRAFVIIAHLIAHLRATRTCNVFHTGLRWSLWDTLGIHWSRCVDFLWRVRFLKLSHRLARRLHRHMHRICLLETASSMESNGCVFGHAGAS